MKTKKELKEEYKQKKFRMGVFQIRNVLNGKIYVDSSVNLDKIWNRHRTQLNFGVHPNAGLQHDWNELGADNFVYEIISEIVQKEEEETDYTREVRLLGEMFMEELQPYGEKGYHKIKI